MLAAAPEFFDILIRNDGLHDFRCLDFMDTPHRTFQNIVFLLQPGKEARYVSANIVDGRLAAVIYALIIHQILPDFFGGYLLDFRLNRTKKMLDRHLVILDRPFGAALNLFRIQEHLKIFFI